MYGSAEALAFVRRHGSMTFLVEIEWSLGLRHRRRVADDGCALGADPSSIRDAAL
jgi:hypothetical protein